MHFDWYSYVVIPLLIFLARIADVSLGTVRIILVSKGMRKVAPIIGFFEVFIWVLAISKIIENLDNWICYFAYAGGFATGNYVGMLIEERLALGYELIRAITKRDAADLVNELKGAGFGVTFVSAKGTQGDVGVIYVIISRKKMNEVIDIIKRNNPKTIYTIEDIRFVNRSLFFGRPQLKQKKRWVRK